MGIKSLLSLLDPVTTRVNIIPNNINFSYNRIGIDCLCLMHQGLNSFQTTQKSIDIKRLLHSMNQYVLRTLCKLVELYTQKGPLSSGVHELPNPPPTDNNTLELLELQPTMGTTLQSLNPNDFKLICVFDGFDLDAKSLENQKRKLIKQKHQQFLNSIQIFRSKLLNEPIPNVKPQHGVGISQYVDLSSNDNLANAANIATITPQLNNLPAQPSHCNLPKPTSYEHLHSLNPFMDDIFRNDNDEIVANLPSNSPNLENPPTLDLITAQQITRSLALSYDISIDDVLILISLLETHPILKNHIECIISPYQADSQLAYLSKINYVDVVYTEDSDLVVYGSHNSLFKLLKNKNEFFGDLIKLNEITQCPIALSSSQADKLLYQHMNMFYNLGFIQQDKTSKMTSKQHLTIPALIKNSLQPIYPSIDLDSKNTVLFFPMKNWSQYDLIIFAVLSGCDFLPNLPSCGPKTLHKVIISSQLENISTLLQGKLGMLSPHTLSSYKLPNSITPSKNHTKKESFKSFVSSLHSEIDQPVDWSTVMATLVSKSYYSAKISAEKQTQNRVDSIQELTHGVLGHDINQFGLYTISSKTSTEPSKAQLVTQLDQFLITYAYYFKIPIRNDSHLSQIELNNQSKASFDLFPSHLFFHLTIEESINIYEMLVYRILLIFRYETVWDPISKQLTSCNMIDNQEYLDYLLQMAGFDQSTDTVNSKCHDVNPNHDPHSAVQVDKQSVVYNYPHLGWLLGSVSIPDYSPTTDWILLTQEKNLLGSRSNAGNLAYSSGDNQYCTDSYVNLPNVEFQNEDRRMIDFEEELLPPLESQYTPYNEINITAGVDFCKDLDYITGFDCVMVGKCEETILDEPRSFSTPHCDDLHPKIRRSFQNQANNTPSLVVSSRCKTNDGNIAVMGKTRSLTRNPTPRQSDQNGQISERNKAPGVVKPLTKADHTKGDNPSSRKKPPLPVRQFNIHPTHIPTKPLLASSFIKPTSNQKGVNMANEDILKKYHSKNDDHKLQTNLNHQNSIQNLRLRHPNQVLNHLELTNSTISTSPDVIISGFISSTQRSRPNSHSTRSKLSHTCIANPTNKNKEQNPHSEMRTVLRKSSNLGNINHYFETKPPIINSLRGSTKRKRECDDSSEVILLRNELLRSQQKIASLSHQLDEQILHNNLHTRSKSISSAKTYYDDDDDDDGDNKSLHFYNNGNNYNNAFISNNSNHAHFENNTNNNPYIASSNAFPPYNSAVDHYPFASSDNIDYHSMFEKFQGDGQIGNSLRFSPEEIIPFNLFNGLDGSKISCHGYNLEDLPRFEDP
jgi:5'-3' exonuclease